jgi:hypothetical protein
VHEQYSDVMEWIIVLSGNLIAYSLASNGSETIVFKFCEGSIIGANLLFGSKIDIQLNIYCTSGMYPFPYFKNSS